VVVGGWDKNYEAHFYKSCGEKKQEAQQRKQDPCV